MLNQKSLPVGIPIPAKNNMLLAQSLSYLSRTTNYGGWRARSF